jgi:hypothetical protein
MLKQEIRALDTGNKAIRSFGKVIGLVLVGIAVFVVWRRGWSITPVSYWLSGLGAGLIVFGYLAPTALKPLYLAWMTLALVLGYIMTRVILTVVFFGIISPIGLVRRLMGRDPMHRTIPADAQTYWIPRTDTDRKPERLERYF